MTAQYGTAVVLAAGSSSRFGSDKRLAHYAGQPLLSAALAPYAGVFATILVVTRGESEIEPLLPRGCRAVAAKTAADGISQSLATGIQAAGDVPWVIVGLGDMPSVQSATLKLLRDTIDSDRQHIIRPRFRGQPGNPVAFPSGYFEALQNLEGDQGARQIIGRHNEQVRFVDVADRGVLYDVDVPEQVPKDEV